jgi:hypothetical protein
MRYSARTFQLHAGLAQLFRARPCQGRGQGLESPNPHHTRNNQVTKNPHRGSFLIKVLMYQTATVPNSPVDILDFVVYDSHMKKKKIPSSLRQKNRIITLIILSVLILVVSTTGLFLGMHKYRYYDDAANVAGTAPTRDLILLAVRGAKKNAPVDAKTGDVYFPEAKLYLPNPNIALPLTYFYDTGENNNHTEELSISTYPVRGTEQLYTAKNQKELFDAVPKLQSCARGFKVTYKAMAHASDGITLQHSRTLQNGKQIFIYLEKTCPELKPFSESLKNLQSY